MDDHSRIETIDDINAMNRCLSVIDKDESPFSNSLCLIAPVGEDENGFLRFVVALARTMPI